MCENKNQFDLKECLEIVLKKYNNYLYSSTKYKPNEIFLSNSEELYNNALNNIKNSLNI